MIGGGLSGIVTAYELMKLGLRPVVYEIAEIGGRLRTVRFPGCPDDVVAEMGAMRFPPASTALFHYIDKVGLETTPFPNPLAPGTPSTVVDLKGQSHYARTPADLPQVFARRRRRVGPDARRARVVRRDADRDPRPRREDDQAAVERARPEAGQPDVLRLPLRLPRVRLLPPPRDLRPGRLRHRRLGHRLPQLHPGNPARRLHRRRRRAPQHRRRQQAAPAAAVGARAGGASLSGPRERRWLPCTKAGRARASRGCTGPRRTTSR